MNVYQRRSSDDQLAGRYFTPEPLVEAVLSLVDPTPDDIVVDPACGDGAFLVGAVRWMSGQLRADALVRWAVERLRGIELDADTAALARSRVAREVGERGGAPVAPERLDVVVGDGLLDFPTSVAAPGRRLFVGNPPFVEAKRLAPERKAELKARFPGAVAGAPDLALYFLHHTLAACRPGDAVALVLPNKVLVNRQALALRRRLFAEYELQAVVFATDLGLFEGAAVYPVVLHARRPTGEQDLQTRLYRPRSISALSPLPEPTVVPAASYERTAMRAIHPVPEDGALASLLDQLLDRTRSGPRLSDLFEVRWTVSFHRRGLRGRFTSADRPDSPHARHFVGGGAWAGNGEVPRYAVRWGGGWIDYDLDALRAARNPLPDPSLFERDKVVLCQNSRTPRAAFDDSGAVFKDTFVLVLPRGSGDHPLQQELRALVAVLNSDLAHFFYAHVFFGGHVGGGYLHFLRSFVDDFPLGDWSSTQAEAAAQQVRHLERRSGAEADDRALRTLVRERFGLGVTQARALDAWLEANAAWAARDRIAPPKGRRSSG